MNNLPKNHGAGPQRRGAQCSCIGCNRLEADPGHNSNGIKLGPPKCDKKDDPQVWAASFLHLITLTEREKNLNPKAMITYKKLLELGKCL